MSYEAGSVIGGIERGESDTDSAIKSDSGTQGRTGEPEIIGGYESADPRTERIGDRGNPGDGVKRTKDGRIDGRTTRGKRGPYSTGTQKSDAVGVGFDKLDLSEVIFSAHQMLSGFVAELELDKDESEKLAGAVKEVGKFYGATFDPKKVAIFNLCLVAGGIYGTRFFAIRNRIAASKVARPPTPKPTPIRTSTTQAQSPVNGKGEVGTTPVESMWGMGGDASL